MHSGANRYYRQYDWQTPISSSPGFTGAGVGFLATLITWFIAVGIVSDLSQIVSALTLQAATGLLGVVVLLVIMNWFLHKIYWSGWMTMHNRRKKTLLERASEAESIKTVSGARTCFYSPERDELFLAVRAGFLSGSAEVRIYRPRP